jgi:hypothetical protein
MMISTIVDGGALNLCVTDGVLGGREYFCGSRGFNAGGLTVLSGLPLRLPTGLWAGDTSTLVKSPNFD